MPSISVSKPAHRYDSLTKPVITPSGFTSGSSRVIAGNQFSSLIANGVGVQWNPKNRSMNGDDSAVIQGLEMSVPSWNVTGDVAFQAGTNGLLKTGTDSFGSGAYVNDVTGDFGIEGSPTTNTLRTQTLSLQSGAAVYDFITDPNAEHCMTFGQYNTGSLWELSVYKGQFTYATGDYGIITREGDVVRYYIVRAGTGEAELIRSTRSKLAASAKAVVMLYHNGSRMDQVRVWTGAQYKMNYEIFGVLNSDFQDWQNPAQLESLAEKTMNKDKREDFTFYTEQMNLMTLSLALDWRTEDKYQEFKEFFQWHDLSKTFIFKDLARTKLLMKPTFPLADNEMFCKFISAFKDNPMGAGLYGASVDIRQAITPTTVYTSAM